MTRFSKVVFTITFLIGIGILAVTNPVLFGRSHPAVHIQVDSVQLKQDVVHLCSFHQSRSAEHPAQLDSAANWLRAQLTAAGIESEEQVYTADGKTYRNVICSFGPREGERVIVGAHYDVCGEQPGADDNASGTAGLLELARQLKKNAPALRYRTDLVFYTLEEPPNYDTPNMGSLIHAESLKKAGVKVKLMVCLEMIGFYSSEKHSQEYPVGAMKLFYPDKANYIAVVGKLGQGRVIRNVKRRLQAACGIDVRSVNAPKFIPGIDFSDHRSYWSQGYEAVMITNTAFYRNKNYHQPTDTPETLDYGRMAEVVKGIYNVVAGM